MNAPREAYAGSNFVIVRMDAVRALDNSWEAAGCFQRIAWRCERDGSWRATMQEIADEIGVSVRTAKRITEKLRERGWIEGNRDKPYDATLTWSICWADQSANLSLSDGPDGHAESANLSLSRGANGALSPSPETEETEERRQAADAADDRTSNAIALPEDFAVTDKMRDWWNEQGFNAHQPLVETEKFIDYWRGIGGARGRKRDWPGTWRNWMRSAEERALTRRPPGQIVRPSDKARAEQIERFEGVG